MILMVSGRTDIVAFYSKWFLNRYKEGFIDVRNPFNPKLISRINFEDVDLIMFCTKNPLPIIKSLKDIKKPILFVRQIGRYSPAFSWSGTLPPSAKECDTGPLRA